MLLTGLPPADACLINTCFKACGMLNAYAARKSNMNAIIAGNGVQASTVLSSADEVPMVTAYHKLGGFSVATFDAAAQNTVRPCSASGAAAM